jgi:hypothetical protein
MNAEKAPSDRQSRFVCGFEKLKYEDDENERIEDDERPQAIGFFVAHRFVVVPES